MILSDNFISYTHKAHNMIMKANFEKYKTKEALPPQRIYALSRANVFALKLLVEYGVNEVTAYDWILPTIPTTAKGYEDVYVKNAIWLFKKTSNHVDANTFCVWWIDLNVYGGGGIYEAQVSDMMQRFKENQKQSNGEAYKNRLTAVGMSNTDFERLFKQSA